jgi:hypothetical protein
MSPQSYCSPFCDRTSMHVHPAIPADLARPLREAASRDGLAYDDVRRRIVSLAARLVRARGKTSRVWLETDGRRGTWIPADPSTDKTMNVLRRSSTSAAYLLSQALVTYKVVIMCERSSLQEVFSRLESSSGSPSFP